MLLKISTNTTVVDLLIPKPNWCGAIKFKNLRNVTIVGFNQIRPVVSTNVLSKFLNTATIFEILKQSGKIPPFEQFIVQQQHQVI